MNVKIKLTISITKTLIITTKMSLLIYEKISLKFNFPLLIWLSVWPTDILKNTETSITPIKANTTLCQEIGIRILNISPKPLITVAGYLLMNSTIWKGPVSKPINTDGTSQRSKSHQQFFAKYLLPNLINLI